MIERATRGCLGLTFVSKRIDKIDGQHGRIVGDLTIRDITQEAVLDVEHQGAIDEKTSRIVD